MKYAFAIRLFAIGSLAACAHQQIDVEPQVALPDQFSHTAAAQGQAEIMQWWRAWPDPLLGQLVEQGLAANRDLAATRAKLIAARATAATARADLGPQAALTGSVGAHNVQLDNPLGSDMRQGLSAFNTPLSDDSQRLSGHNSRLGFSARWEPDIFGAKRSDADAANYAALGEAEKWHGAQMLLATDIADHYLQVRALQQRIRSGQNSIATLQQLHRYSQGRFHAGQASDYDVRDIAAKVSALQAQQATLQAQADAHTRILAVLTGQIPQNFTLPDVGTDVLTNLPAAPSGQQPLQVLERRPDVRANRAAVQAYSAKLASARADLLPRFDIQFVWQTGRIRLDSDLPAMKGLGGLVSAGVTLPIFTAGRIQRNIDAADARLSAALAQYDHSILNALAEVDSSYQLQYSLNRQNRWLADAVAQAQQQATGADKLFRYGHLTLDRSLSARLNAEDLAERQIQGRLAEAQNLLNIYKALGGGWHGQDAEPAFRQPVKD